MTDKKVVSLKAIEGLNEPNWELERQLEEEIIDLIYSKACEGRITVSRIFGVLESVKFRVYRNEYDPDI